MDNNKKTDMSASKNNIGYLEIFVGSMWSGKTSKLLEMHKQYTFCNIPVVVINHAVDIRYHDSMLSTHDKIMIPCIQTSNIADIWVNSNSMYYETLHNADVILINEAQFFNDLQYCVTDMLKEKKKVYISGLDGDFERKKFGEILDLIPICDKVTKLTALCSICKDGTPGIFSLRLSKETQQMLIGSDNYLPVCRKCYDLEENVDERCESKFSDYTPERQRRSMESDIDITTTSTSCFSFTDELYLSPNP
jgi:thymidine kinase